MRELKFRAWDSKNKTMLNWERFSLGYAMFWLNDPKTTGLIFLQWTGLFDKQGKEIYESDLLSGAATDRGIEVVFSGGEFWGKESNDSTHLRAEYFGSREVIGNVHEG